MFNLAKALAAEKASSFKVIKQSADKLYLLSEDNDILSLTNVRKAEASKLIEIEGDVITLIKGRSFESNGITFFTDKAESTPTFK